MRPGRLFPPLLVVASLFAFSLAFSCGPLGRSDRVAYDERFELGEGEGRAFNLPPGSYRLNLTAGGEEVSAEWIGGECPRHEHASSLEATCRISGEGQLVVRNPTEFGAGGAARVVLRITRLARDL